MALRAGAARVVITPPVGVELAGYGFGPSVGILDDLEAQALVLEDGQTSAAIVTVDLLTVGPEFVANVRKRAQAELGIPGENISICASHSHSTPTAFPLRQWGRVDAVYVSVLESVLVGTIKVARDRAQEARLGIGLGRADNLSENRRGLLETSDVSVPVLRLENLNGNPIAVLFNFACHPVSLHSYRNLLSPDYPGYARQLIRKVLGEETIAMFTLGTAGDINPAGYRPGETTPKRSSQIGTILGCEVAKVALDPHTQEDPVIRVRKEILELPVAPLPPVSELLQMREHFIAEVERLRSAGQPWADISVSEIKRDWATDALQAWENGQGARASVPCEITAFRLGQAALLAAPLEIFTETGLAIKDSSPAKVTLICSNSNGGIGYLATRDAYAANDYTNPNGLAPKVYGLYALAEQAEPIFRQESIRILADLFAQGE